MSKSQSIYVGSKSDVNIENLVINGKGIANTVPVDTSDNQIATTKFVDDVVNHSSVLLSDSSGVGFIAVYDESLNLSSYNRNLLVNSNGDIIPFVNNTQSLGTPTIRWKDIYVGPGSINIQAIDGSNSASLGADNLSVVYSDKGFASLFLNIGLVQGISTETPAAEGG